MTPLALDNLLLQQDVLSRYAFILSVLALESATNALLLSTNLLNTLERKPTLDKIRSFCSHRGVEYDENSIETIRIKELLSCRNAIVHPKQTKSLYEIDDQDFILFDSVRFSPLRNYPDYFCLLKHSHAVSSVQDVLKFTAHICFDCCRMEFAEGALCLGAGSYGSTADFEVVESHLGITFDKRSLGLSPS